MTSKPRESWGKDDEQNIALYGKSLRQHGVSAKALGWSSAESQFIRFRVLAEVGIAPESSVLDVGCGLGDFYFFLQALGHRGTYTGSDITPGMIEVATSRFPNGAFLTADLLDHSASIPMADYVVASGIFTYRTHEPMKFLCAIVDRMFALSQRGLAFNALSGFADIKEPNEFNPDPIEVLRHCLTLTPYVTLRHDYQRGDFTIYALRERRFAPLLAGS